MQPYEIYAPTVEIWRQLAVERELVVTSNVRPLAILTSITEDTVEQSIREVRKARALRAVRTLQQQSVDQNRDRVSDSEINAEIAEARTNRPW